MQQTVLLNWVETMLILIIAITIHEFAHAIAADRLGDDTPRSQGRLSINPIDHLDPLGTLMMAVSTYTGFGIGWGKPVMTHPDRFRHPRRDILLVAVAGPFSNILQALLFAGAVRLNDAQGWMVPGSPGDQLLTTGILINLALTFFNLIPIPPLDGSKVFSALLPVKHAQVYDQFMGTFGLIIFMVLAFTRLSTYLIGPPVFYFYTLLAG
jgi:Zn-dependent protease